MNRPLKVMLVEDERVDVMTFERSLRTRKIDVELCVETAAEPAWERLRDLSTSEEPLPDLVIADLRLPCASGIDLLERIKGDDRFRHLPVVIFSTSSQDCDVARAAAEGAAGYFVKPMDFDDFADRVEAVLKFVAATEVPLPVSSGPASSDVNEPIHYLEAELNERFRTLDTSVREFIDEVATDGFWYWDLLNPEHEWMSPGFWRTLGYDPASKPHLASAWQDIVDQDDLRVAMANFEKHCADPNHPYDETVRYRHRNGSTVWVHCRGIAIRDPEGRPVRMIGAHTDITEHRSRGERLSDAESKLSEIASLLGPPVSRVVGMNLAQLLDRIAAVLRS